MFPDPAIPKPTILSGKSAKRAKGVKPVVSKSAAGNDNYYAETAKGGSTRLGSDREKPR